MVMLVLHAKFEVFLVKFATNVTWGKFSGIFDINRSQYLEKLSKLRTIFACLLDLFTGGQEKKLESFVCGVNMEVLPDSPFRASLAPSENARWFVHIS